MRPRTLLATTLSTLCAIAALSAAGAAHAQPADDPVDDPPVDDTGEADPDAAPVAEADGLPAPALSDTAAQKGPRYGIGLRLRAISIPKGLIELFMEEAAGGVSQVGYGVDFIRRKEEFEFSIGFEYEKLNGKNGYYVENGGDPLRPGTTDFVEFDGFSWLTIDAAFVFHHAFNDNIALRYGGGLGLGILFGDILETDAACTGPDTQNDCTHPGGPQINDPQDLPPVFPVVNALFGVQFRPVDNVLINLEAGLRTALYAGLGLQYLF